jgi:hypothetical protein
VSDALTNDVLGTIEVLHDARDKSGDPYSNANDLSTALSSHVAAGRISLQDDLFWCQPTAFWDTPPEVASKLASSAIVFVKGDANYRRLLGERQWVLETPAKEVLKYWPVPVCALRTFKAEIGCGVSKENAARAQKEDPKWLVSGKWGVVQLGGSKRKL